LFVAPGALEWLSIVEEFQKEQTRCKTNKAHLYYSKLASCPWCEIESHGIIFFVEIGVAVTPGLNVDILLKRLTSLSVLRDLPRIPTLETWQ
jgi:DNA-binding helix-hairpin-helix protein with protein kinase domain